MNNQNPNFDQLRQAWIEMGNALEKLSTPAAPSHHLYNKKTALDRLAQRYGYFAIISLLMSPCGLLFFTHSPFANPLLTTWLGIAYAVYFLTAAAMDFWLWHGISSINPLQLTVSQITDKALCYRKRHFQFMAVLIPMAIALIGFTAYTFSSQTFFINGMIVGVIAGTAIGIIQFRRFMSSYRDLSV